MNVFISGGCKNGKSYFAQKVAQEMSIEKKVPLYYIATMIPSDQEDRERIKRHLAERDGWGFETIEQGKDLCDILNRKIDPSGVFLLDSITALLSNEMFAADGSMNLNVGLKVAKDLETFAKMTGNTVFVSDYIYSDSRRFDEVTEIYRKALADCDRTAAKVCEKVVEVTFGNIIVHKDINK